MTLLGALAASGRADDAAAQAVFEKKVRPLFSKYCFDCHGARKSKGDINIEDYTGVKSIRENPKFWEKVEQQLRSGEMPPEDEEQPSDLARARLIGWIQKTSTRIDLASIPKNPGRVTIRRLNRAEYNHTIRDLVGIDFRPGKNFPADGAGGGGFTNNSDTLFLPPILMEKYLEAAGQVLDRVYEDDRARRRVLVVLPSKDRTPEEAARAILRRFTSLAFRRYTTEDEVGRFMKLFGKARERGTRSRHR